MTQGHTTHAWRDAFDAAAGAAHLTGTYVNLKEFNMTHKEQVMVRALDNLVHRIERGQEYPNASLAVAELYGVDIDELGDAYMDHCALCQPGGPRHEPSPFQI